MPEIARGVFPAGKRLLPLIFLLVIGAPLAAKADNGIVDVRTLPRLEGAVEDTSRTQSYSMSYSVPDRGRASERGYQEAARRRWLDSICAPSR